VRRNPAWAELVQLVPVVVLACSFLVTGEVDLARAGPLFVVAAALTVPITMTVLLRGFAANPILLGAAAWLWLGAVAFGVPVRSLADWLGDTRAVGLFGGALLVGVVATAVSRGGYVGLAHPDQAWVRRTSLALLALTAGAVAWSWEFRTNLRLGGGLPFILVNVARRVAIARAP
jgi:hypothetical protein